MNGSEMKIVLLMMLLIVSTAWAYDACSSAAYLDFSTSGQPDSLDSNWKTWSVISILVSVLMVAILYMIGNVIGHTGLIATARTDLTQIIFTVVILILFSSFVLALCQIDAKQFGLKSSTLFGASRSYFEYTKSLAIATYARSATAIMEISAYASTYITTNLAPPLVIHFGPLKYTPISSISDVPFSGLSAILSVWQFLMSIVMFNVSVASAQLMILDIIEGYVLNLLLPVGVILRCFTPTRELGGMLMALSIGLFLFYPLMFGISYMIAGSPAPVPIPSSNWSEGFYSTLGAISISGIWTLGAVISSLTALPILTEKLVGNAVEAISALGPTLLYVFVLPAINWIIIGIFVKDLSRLMGAEIDISSLSRLM